MLKLKIFLLLHRKLFFILGVIPTSFILFVLYKNGMFPYKLNPYFVQIQNSFLTIQILNFVLYVITMCIGRKN